MVDHLQAPSALGGVRHLELHQKHVLIRREGREEEHAAHGQRSGGHSIHLDQGGLLTDLEDVIGDDAGHGQHGHGDADADQELAPGLAVAFTVEEQLGPVNHRAGLLGIRTFEGYCQNALLREGDVFSDKRTI